MAAAAEIGSVIGNLLLHGVVQPVSSSLDLVPATAGCMIKSVSGWVRSHLRIFCI